MKLFMITALMLTTILSTSVFAANDCGYKEGSYKTITKSNSILSNGMTYTVKAKSPKGTCEYLDSTESPKKCEALAIAEKGYSCFQTTEGKTRLNKFFYNGTFENTTFTACWGCY